MVRAARFGEDRDLTTREVEVLGELLRGGSEKAIAKRLGIAASTVATHMSRIYATLGVCRRSELFALVFGTASR